MLYCVCTNCRNPLEYHRCNISYSVCLTVFLCIPILLTYDYNDWQCAICSLEDVNAIKPGKVSSYANFIFLSL